MTGLPNQTIARVPPGAHWIFLCTWCSATGWILSAFGALNLAGYLASISLSALVWFICFRGYKFDLARTFSAKRFRRRFSRPLPLFFLLLAILAFFGGILYFPSNYDGLTYRIPRVLHWLAAGEWHWIHTEFQRLNVRATGWEWCAAPLICFTHSFRPLFLINTACFFLLPGLIFSVFVGLGINRRVAYYWMWLLPTGYCFLLQAGSIGNDLFGAVFVLASVDFSLRARESGRVRDVWFSIVSAALVTGAKSGNLPLLLPWALAIFPSLGLLRKQISGTAAILALSILVSLVPISYQNIRYTRDWTGLKAENIQVSQGDALLHVGANAVLLTIQNFVPPLFPFAHAWNTAVEKIVPAHLRSRLENTFEPGGAHFGLGEMAVEEESGLGFGISVLLLITVIATIILKHRSPSPGFYQTSVIASPWISLLFFMGKSGLSGAARLISPYYPLLIPAFLFCGANARLVRSQRWRGCAFSLAALSILPLFASPARPLWPVHVFLGRTDAAHSSNRLLRRAADVYAVYGNRGRAFEPARAALPPGIRTLGFVSFDDPEASLWMPLSALRIEHVTSADKLVDLQVKKIEYVLVSSQRFKQLFTDSFEEWLANMHAEIVWKMPLTLRATDGSIDWFLVRMPQVN